MPLGTSTTIDKIPELENKAGLQAFEYSTTSTGVESLPSNEVASGVTVLLWTQPDNSGRVNVGNDSAQPIPLPPDATLELRIENTDQVSIQTPNSGDALGVLFEDG